MVYSFEGQQKESKIFWDGEIFFFYIKNNKSKSGTTYLKCIHKDCPGTAKFSDESVNLDDCVLIHNKSHNHPEDKTYKPIKELRKEVLNRIMEETLSTATIFKQECAKIDVQICSKVVYKKICSSLYKARKRFLPPTPHTVEEYGRILSEHVERFGKVDGEDFFIGTSGDTEYTMSVIFIVKPLMEIFQSSKEHHLDGTFKAMPAGLNARQIYTIHCIYEDFLFPVVIAIMASKSRAAYEALFRKLKELMPDFQPKLFISDFEKALKVAVKEIFGDSVTHVGCYFHFGNAILGKVKLLGLTVIYRHDKNVRKSVRLLIALALLPPGRIREGYEYILVFVDNSNLRNTLQPLLRYFESEWLQKVTPEGFSVYNLRNRTNNTQEAFHRTLNRTIRSKSDAWTFTDGLRLIAATSVRDYLRIEEGEDITWPRKIKWLRQDLTIAAKTKALDEGRITVGYFLRVCSYRFSIPDPDFIVETEEAEALDAVIQPVAAAAAAVTELEPPLPLIPAVIRRADEEAVVELDAGQEATRPRGRPRRNPPAQEVAPLPARRGPGRPRRNPPPQEVAPLPARRGPGRPRRNPPAQEVAPPPARRGPGRPRRNPPPTAVQEVAPVAAAPVVEDAPAYWRLRAYIPPPEKTFSRNFLQTHFADVKLSVNDMKEESEEIGAFEAACLICLTDKPSVQAKPCAHPCYCVPCAKDVAENPLHEVIFFDEENNGGNVYNDELRPIQCPLCRALIFCFALQ